ncbi:MAG: DUF1565 domain-containing protein [Candidatus Marinimicrobia bacterium]|nr:DUF1565 domain-containing protein [Candidatus Neomarinimicrobiota bacterium]
MLNNKITKLISAICVICGLVSGLLFATTINIPADYSTIQAGLNSASEGDTVQVSAGTYYENITWPATNSIQLIGSGEEDCIIDGDSLASVIRFTSSNIDTTTLITGFSIQNGFAQGDYPYNHGGGIYCSSSSPSLANVTISGNSAEGVGGGIYCRNYSCPSFSSENRCNIYSNTISNSRGAGADIFANNCPVIDVIVDTFTVLTPTEYHASPLDNFTFDILNSIIPEEDQVNADLYVSPDGDNSNDGLTAETPLKTIQYATSIILADSTNPHTIHLANGIYSPSTNGEYFPVEVINYVSLVGESEDGVILDAEGVAGVMRCRYVTSATISHLTLTNGSASSGGGIYCRESSPSLANVTISGNSASEYGGGIYCEESSPSLANVTISNNSASEYGGGVFCYNNSSPTFVNVTISNNSASSNGGGMYLNNSSPSLVDVTITANYASFGGGIFCWDNSSPSLVNCILWNDAPQEVYFNVYSDPNSIMIAYSDIQGGEAGIVTNDNGTVNWEDGNINLDPLFVDEENGDFHLQESSPCIDAGTAFFVFEGDTLVDMSEDEYVGSAPDMGAFEYGEIAGIEDDYELLITNYELMRAYPNPFNPSTTISYAVESNGRLSLQIYNITGQLVETLVNEQVEAGYHTVVWNANNQPSGIYFAVLSIGGFSETQKLLLLK